MDGLGALAEGFITGICDISNTKSITLVIIQTATLMVMVAKEMMVNLSLLNSAV